LGKNPLFFKEKTSMQEPIHVLGFSGSLRKASFNAGLLRAARELLPENMILDVFDLAPLPFYNQDLETDLPEIVRTFRATVAAADALLIVTPEYNYSIPGVLKNAIDWASRPVKESSLNDKPVAFMGAGGVMGTSRAQAHLRQVAVFTNMHPLNKPEVQVQRSWEKFDAYGNLTDETTRQAVQQLLIAFAAWTRRLKGC
jgi:chromate reductase